MSEATKVAGSLGCEDVAKQVVVDDDGGQLGSREVGVVESANKSEVVVG